MDFNWCTTTFNDHLTSGCDIFEKGESTPIADPSGLLDITSFCVHINFSCGAGTEDYQDRDV